MVTSPSLSVGNLEQGSLARRLELLANNGRQQQLAHRRLCQQALNLQHGQTDGRAGIGARRQRAVHDLAQSHRSSSAIVGAPNATVPPGVDRRQRALHRGFASKPEQQARPFLFQQFTAGSFGTRIGLFDQLAERGQRDRFFAPGWRLQEATQLQPEQRTFATRRRLRRWSRHRRRHLGTGIGQEARQMSYIAFNVFLLAEVAEQ